MSSTHLVLASGLVLHVAVQTRRRRAICLLPRAGKCSPCMLRSAPHCGDECRAPQADRSAQSLPHEPGGGGRRAHVSRFFAQGQDGISKMLDTTAVCTSGASAVMTTVWDGRTLLSKKGMWEIGSALGTPRWPTRC